jgi:ribokinase
MRVAVVGHVEWVEFARVERVPTPGEIVQASEWWSEAAGGGGVASVQLARLAGSCTLFTALGRGELGELAYEQLTKLGVTVEAIRHEGSQRRGFTFVDERGERTITILGEKHLVRASDPLPWESLAEADAVYFVSGDPDALRAARAGRVLVATARVLPTIAAARVELDGLVRSGSDRSEHYEPGDVTPEPRLVVATAAVRGGAWSSADGQSGSYDAAPLPGPLADAYGAGDSFAAGLTYALGADLPVGEALAVAARCGAEAMTRPGAHGSKAAPRAS